MKRWRPRARGRATRIRKRTCHITVIVGRYDRDELDRMRERLASKGRTTADPSAARARRVARSRADAATTDDDSVDEAATAAEAEEAIVDELATEATVTEEFAETSTPDAADETEAADEAEHDDADTAEAVAEATDAETDKKDD